MSASPATRADATPRYAAMRSQILDAASAMINERGVKGLSLGDVAERIGLSGTSITYYFKRKNDLAAACYDRALDQLDAQVSEAAAAPDPRNRIARLVSLAFASLAQSDGGEPRPVITWLTDMRATDEPARAVLVQRYYAVFRKARGFFGSDGSEEERLLRVMRTHVLLETIHALPTWLDRYAPEELDRVRHRLVDLLAEGMIPSGPAQRLPLGSPPIKGAEADPVASRFLGAATRLINERGYRGASVERIAAALDVTKGSFYHHLDAKDDLVLACFRRSLATISRAQDKAIAGGGDRLHRLGGALAALIAVQLGDDTPLLRTTALAALPPALRREAIDGLNRIARRFAGMIIDGISDGSLLPIDPLVAGQVLMSSLNVAYELRGVYPGIAPARAIALYASTLLEGLLAPPR